MTNYLPPMNSLKAFEAVSRHLSISGAAKELSVTAGAISQQIKHLESLLEIELLHRADRRVYVTKSGEQYGKVLQKAFNLLRQGTADLINSQENKLSISVEPAFAMYWLLPRLVKFQQAFPEIELQLDVTINVSNMTQDDVDVAIRWGSGDYPGLDTNFLMSNELLPVCSPSYYKKHNIQSPGDLCGCNLLEEKFSLSHVNYPTWDHWLQAVGLSPEKFTKRTYFETGFVLIKAALDGIGIAFERSLLVADLLEQKKLIKLFDVSCSEKDSGYYFVCLPDRKSRENVQAFYTWLKNEIVETI